MVSSVIARYHARYINEASKNFNPRFTHE